MSSQILGIGRHRGITSRHRAPKQGFSKAPELVHDPEALLVLWLVGADHDAVPDAACAAETQGSHIGWKSCHSLSLEIQIIKVSPSVEAGLATWNRGTFTQFNFQVVNLPVSKGCLSLCSCVQGISQKPSDSLLPYPSKRGCLTVCSAHAPNSASP